MKCPKCGYNQKVKYGLTCDGCKYHFVFNPKTSQGLTDGKFVACLRSASQNDTVYFTRNQLYAVYCRQNRASRAAGIGCGIAGLFGTLVLASIGIWPFAVVIAVVAVICLVATAFSVWRKTTPKQFDEVLERWLSAGKKIEFLIEKPSLHKPPPDWKEPDIYDYGVERLLIVERDLLVDLFVKNGAHAEQRMLVISESGYPQYLLPVAQRLLAEQPDLPVFLLHDATAHGVAMKQRLVGGGLLPVQTDALTDLGMFPSDFQQLQRCRQFDPDNKSRELPMDAMLLPFMMTGLASAMENRSTMSWVIQQQRQGSTTDAGTSFG